MYKRRLAILAIGLIALAATALACGGTAAPTSSPSPTPSPSLSSTPATTSTAQSQSRLLGIVLPSRVSAFVAQFGKPDSIRVPTLDERETSPDGQWFRWRKPSGFVFSVLGDEYGSTPSYRANVRCVQLVATHRNRRTRRYSGSPSTERPSKTCGASWGLQFRSASPSARSPSAITATTCSKYGHAGLFTFFYFNPRGRLIGVAQSTFDMDRAG